jgi:hypothetical protein
MGPIFTREWPLDEYLPQCASRYIVHRFSAAIIMSIVYDYSTLPRDDPLIAMIERSLEISVRELRPEVAAVVGEFPIRASFFLLRPYSVTQFFQWRNFHPGFLERAL